MKTIIKNMSRIAHVEKDSFSSKRAIVVVALLLGFVTTTIYLMITCYN